MDIKLLERWRWTSQSPQTGQVYFNKDGNSVISAEMKPLGLNPLKRVKFISIKKVSLTTLSSTSIKSQSPQTGQVYFNIIEGVWERKAIACLNPLKRVKFISIQRDAELPVNERVLGLNPLKRVKFISMHSSICFYYILHSFFVSIPSNGSSLFQFESFCKFSYSIGTKSQSPQTGQVYFNTHYFWENFLISCMMSQSPQTGQVYFN